MNRTTGVGVMGFGSYEEALFKSKNRQKLGCKKDYRKEIYAVCAPKKGRKPQEWEIQDGHL